MPKIETTITEIEEFEPSRVDGVGKGANGFPILMLKGIDAEAVKADDERKDCATCDGTGKIMAGNRDCPDCMASGKSPKVGETAKQYVAAIKEMGVAPSTAPFELTEQDCPTCNGSGTIADNTHDGKMCVDCGGTGIDQTMANEKELSEVNADPGRISVGDPEGRERIDKSDGCPGCAVAMDNGDKEGATCGAGLAKGNDADGFRPMEYKPDADETVQCPKCERMNDTDAAYCDQCGHELMGDHHVIVDGEPLKEADDDLEEDAEKAKADPDVGGGRVRENIAEADFAGKDRSFPLVTTGDVSDAASSLGRAGADNFSTDKIKANIIAIAKRKGQSFVDELPQKWQDEMAEKAMESLATPDGAVFSAPNPALGHAEPDADNMMPADDDMYPGSPSWEAIDAATATAAATALMAAAELIRKFGERESIEVAAGEGNDLYDATAAEAALMGVSQALGIMAQMAFHEGVEARKGADESVEKAGKRISGKSITALAAARDHLNMVLGADDPAKKDNEYDSGDSAAAKDAESVDKALLAKEIENMSTDELEKVLNAREERLVEVLAGVLKGEVSKDEAPSVDSADAATELDEVAKEDKAEKTAMADDDAETEDAKKDDDTEKDDDTKDDAMKSEDVLTSEEIEAKSARKEAKKALKAAERAEKDAAENAAVQKAIAEGVAEATAAVLALQERLSTVEKMAAPSTIVRTRPQEAFAKSAEKDELDMRIAQLERVARETPDQDIRKAAREEAKELRDQIAALSA